MFSVIFPGQGSQIVGMCKEFYDNFDYVKNYFDKADDLLKKKLSHLIFNGSKEELDLTENTQPAIFLVSYSIFKVIEQETDYQIKNAKYFSGHSLGEYSALCCAESLSFDQTIELLKQRGISMQNAVPKGQGGMLAILGANYSEINNLLNENFKKYKCYIANDNSIGQIVVSGKTDSIESLDLDLRKKNIKSIKLSVSAPFHCPLMTKATDEMRHKISQTIFFDPNVEIISNVTANPVSKAEDIKKLLVEQIEKPVRWRESVSNMIGFGVNNFIEIGPGKILSGLVKRIDRKVKLNQVNNLSDLKKLND